MIEPRGAPGAVHEAVPGVPRERGEGVRGVRRLSDGLAGAGREAKQREGQYCTAAPVVHNLPFPFQDWANALANSSNLLFMLKTAIRSEQEATETKERKVCAEHDQCSSRPLGELVLVEQTSLFILRYLCLLLFKTTGGFRFIL